MKTTINIAFTNIKNIDKSSSMSLSQTYKKNINVTNKRNEGHGEENADSVILLNTKQSVWDDDFLDSVNIKKTNR